jgi:hypothetical protein
MNEAVEAYRHVTATDEFKYLERLRATTRHDEAQALRNAEKRGEERGEKRGAKVEREKWQGVVSDKDAIIAELRARLVED